MKPIPLNEWRKRKAGHDGRLLKVDPKVRSALVDLKDFVENLNKAPKLAYRDGIYKGIGLEDIQTLHMDGVEIGYQLQDKGIFVRRRVFIKVPGYKLREIPHEQIDPIVTAAMYVFLDKGAKPPEIKLVAGDCMRIEQDFMPLYWTERNPNLVVPGKK